MQNVVAKWPVSLSGQQVSCRRRYVIVARAREPRCSSGATCA